MKKNLLFISMFLLSTIIITAQPVKRVVIEEGTGSWCGWCPMGNVSISKMHEDFGNKVILIGVHAFDPMEVTEYLPFYSFPGYPSANIDRSENGVTFSDDDEGNLIDTWYPIVEERIGIKPEANVNVTTVFDPLTRNLEIVVSAEFFEDITGDYRLIAVICEDAVTGPSPGYDQANFLSGGIFGDMGGYGSYPRKIYSNMIAFNHVSREILGTLDGMENSLPETISSGEIYNYSFFYTLPEEWNENYISAVGMLIKPDSSISNAGKSKYIAGNENAAPLFVSMPITNGVMNSRYSYSIYAVDPDNQDLTIQAVETPEWLSLQDVETVGIIHTKAVLTGIPTETGKYPVSLILSDGTSNVEQNFEIDVTLPLDTDWKLVGQKFFSQNNANISDIVFDSFGSAYVIVNDGNEELTTKVYKRELGKEWVYLEGIDIGPSSNCNLCMDSENNLIISYKSSNQIFVKKWDGSALLDIGEPLPNANNLSMALDSKDMPYLAMLDYPDRNGKVKRFNGSEWEILGDVAYSGTAYTTANRIIIDGFDDVYVLWCDHYAGKLARVSKYNGESWSFVGGDAVSTIGVNNFLSLAINDKGKMYVAYQDISTSELLAYEYKGDTWHSVGVDIANGPIDYLDMAITENSNLIVAYIDISQNSSISSMIYDGNEWSHLGNKGFTMSRSSYPVLSVFGEVPFVCYSDFANNGKASTMQYGDIGLSINDNYNNISFVIYPNPVKDKLNIEFDNPSLDNIGISLFNLLGQDFINYSNTSGQQHIKAQIEMNELPVGVYLIKIQIGSQTYIRKIIK